MIVTHSIAVKVIFTIAPAYPNSIYHVAIAITGTFCNSKASTHATFVEDVLDRVDAVELYNGGVPPKVNRRAASFLESIDKPITVGSDSHRLRTYGSCGVYLNRKPETDAATLFGTMSEDKVHDTEMTAGSIALTLPVIMLNHTLFFVRSNKHPRWRPK